MNGPPSERSWRIAASRRRAAFGLIDLWAILAILAVLFAAFGPTAWFVRQGNGRIRCAANLRQIGYALQLYANANGGRFPRARYDADAPNPAPTAYTKWQASSPFAPDGPGPNDVTAALFLLLRTQGITADVFVCPDSEAATPWDLEGKTKESFANFPGRKHLSYSLARTPAGP